MQVVEIKKVREGALVPKYATSGAAGLDLVAALDSPVFIRPGETVKIPTGVAINIKDPGVACMLLPRSGLGVKDGIVLGNLVGLCDSDYQGEYVVALWNRNHDGLPFIVNPGDRIAQAVFVPVIQVQFQEVEEFANTTARGTGGFGSTGKKTIH